MAPEHEVIGLTPGDPTPPINNNHILQSLSSRQIEIAIGVANGQDDKGIALIMGLSNNTVHSHLREINRKTGISDRTALAVEVIRSGLVPRIRAEDLSLSDWQIITMTVKGDKPDQIAEITGQTAHVTSARITTLRLHLEIAEAKCSEVSFTTNRVNQTPQLKPHHQN